MTREANTPEKFDGFKVGQKVKIMKGRPGVRMQNKTGEITMMFVSQAGENCAMVFFKKTGDKATFAMSDFK